jgi:large subunit ribosomal protein L24
MAGGKPAQPFPGKLHIRNGDLVEIITGKDKGRQGKVIQVLPKTGKVVVEGLNLVVRHTKAQPTQKNPNPESGRLEKPAPILASKVMLVGGDGKPTRVRIQTNPDGTKTRVSTRTGQPVQAA